MIINVSAEILEVLDTLERKAKVKLAIAEKHLWRSLSVGNIEAVRTLKVQAERISEALDHAVYLYGCNLGLLKPGIDKRRSFETNSENSTLSFEDAA